MKCKRSKDEKKYFRIKHNTINLIVKTSKSGAKTGEGINVGINVVKNIE